MNKTAEQLTKVSKLLFITTCTYDGEHMYSRLHCTLIHVEIAFMINRNNAI